MSKERRLVFVDRKPPKLVAAAVFGYRAARAIGLHLIESARFRGVDRALLHSAVPRKPGPARVDAGDGASIAAAAEASVGYTDLNEALAHLRENPKAVRYVASMLSDRNSTVATNALRLLEQAKREGVDISSAESLCRKAARAYPVFQGSVDMLFGTFRYARASRAESDALRGAYRREAARRSGRSAREEATA